MAAGRTVGLTVCAAVVAASLGYAGGGPLRRTLTAERTSTAAPATTAPAATPTAPATSPSASASSALEAAKRATVRLEGLPGDGGTDGGTDGGSGALVGSGSIVSPDGLVLTNAHVAAPQAPGLALRYEQEVSEADPPALLVSVNPPDDGPAEERYRASLLVADGTLDLAVLRIDALADGSPLPPGTTFPWLARGDVDALRTGDPLTVLGYPGVANRSLSLSVTRGDVATFASDPLGLVEGERFEIDTSARVAGGNSGGAAVDAAGRLVGVPSARSGTDEYSGRVRAVSYAEPLLALAEQGAVDGYVSPHLPPTAASVVAVGWSGPDGDPCADPAPAGRVPPGGLLRAGVRLAGAEPGLDVQFVLLHEGEVVERRASWLTDHEGDCIGFTHAPWDGVAPGAYALRVMLGPDRRQAATGSAVVDPELAPAPDEAYEGEAYEGEAYDETHGEPYEGEPGG